ncbi:MAG: menaquinone biosynthesis protein [Terrimicrobiaceae bacterium]
MSSYDSALAGLRIGPVPYLNAKPLIWGLSPALLDMNVPAELSRKFFAEGLDVALLPVYEILRAGRGRIADDVAIACQGEVYSVIVASRTTFAESGTIYLDPASRSSTALLRVLVAEFYPQGPSIARDKAIPENAARLLIGDAAIEFRRKNGTAWRYHDLGLLWQQHTGLPFVFAVWAVSERARPSVFDTLRLIKAEGLAARKQIAQREPNPDFALRYLTNHIRYDMGGAEKMAIRRFERLSRLHSILPLAERANLEFL